MTKIQNKDEAELNKKPVIGTDSLESGLTESGKTIRTTGSHLCLAKLSSSAFDNNIYSNNPSQSQNNTSSNIENSFSIHNNLVLFPSGFGIENIINNNCSNQSNNCTKEIESNNHNNYSCEYCGLGLSTITMLTTHSQTATSSPNKATHVLLGLIEEMKKGITREAKKICPRLANIPETTFSCSKDNLESFIGSNYTNEQDNVSSML